MTATRKFSAPDHARPAVNVLPNTRIATRTDIFEDDVVGSEATETDTRRMDALMRQLMGDNTEENPSVSEEIQQEDQEEKKEEEEVFSFRLFSSKPVTTVDLHEEENTADVLAKKVASQQIVDHDEDDPEFRARVAVAAISHEQIMKQSAWPYPALKYSHRVLHIPAVDPSSTEESIKKKRKSKKRRDFEKAVREGRIQVKPNMRNPETPGGWPGWPGRRTRYAIITKVDKDLKRNKYKNHSGRGGSGGRGRHGNWTRR
ncbi:hypothetical protein EC973_005545 [Apophysomyces ossiformis]|uniref:Uncharacterized protein n=1 Tax=Apophysomyces ossiformis TaxID=679940 RepID=A0A8H7BJI4_9FUNG|nr:hypothetical protein EC973_005545 [Apophysomyces ossiformis]